MQTIRLLLTMPFDTPFADVMQQTLAHHMNAGRLSIFNGTAPFQFQQPAPSASNTAVDLEPTNAAQPKMPLSPNQRYEVAAGSPVEKESYKLWLPTDAIKVLRKIAEENSRTMTSVARTLVEAWLAENRAMVKAGRELQCASVFELRGTQFPTVVSPELRLGLRAARASVLSKQEQDEPLVQQERLAFERILLAALSDRITAA